MKKAIFAAIAAAIGPFICSYLWWLLFPWPTNCPSLGFDLSLPLGAALFSLIGFWCGSIGSKVTPDHARARKLTASFCAIGAALGTCIGFFTVERLAFHLANDEWERGASGFAGLFLGVPVGAVVSCLIGLKLESSFARRKSPDSEAKNDIKL